MDLQPHGSLQKPRASAGLPEMALHSLDTILSVESSQAKGLLGEWENIQVRREPGDE